MNDTKSIVNNVTTNMPNSLKGSWRDEAKESFVKKSEKFR